MPESTSLHASILTRIVNGTAVFLAVFLAGCGGGSSSGEGSLSSGLSVSPTTVSGSVGDGPVTGATVTVRDAGGNVVVTGVSNNMANYSLQVPQEVEYPLTIEAADGIDIVTNAAPSFTMSSVALDPQSRVVHINPFSTLITEIARQMENGITPGNIQLATDIVLDQFAFGLDDNLFPDPIASEITETNVAAVIKATEVLAEVFRRAHASLAANGHSAGENDLIRVLAADLTDGYLDGEGVTGASPVAAAVTTIVSAEVLVEALAGNLYVNDQWATGAMDSAIKTVMPSATDVTGDVKITAAMLLQAQSALAAVYAVTGSADVASVQQIIADTLASEEYAGAQNQLSDDPLGNFVIGVKPAWLQPALTYDLSDDIDSAVDSITSDDTTVATVNQGAKERKNDAPPKVSLTSADALVTSGQNTVLFWSSSNAVSCTASGGWSGTKAPAGSENTGQLAEKQEFSISCLGESGKTASAAVTVDVLAAPDEAEADPDPVNDSPDDADTTPDTGEAGTDTNTGGTGADTDAGFSAIRVNVGGEDYTDMKGRLWTADYGYTTGTAYVDPFPVLGTTDETLYHSGRWHGSSTDVLEYRFMVPEGHYRVNLHFVDTLSDAGQRIFDIKMEDFLAHDNLDIYAEVGAHYALIKQFDVDVVDGELNIRFLHPLAKNPKVNAIEIVQLSQNPIGMVPTWSDSGLDKVLTVSWNPNPVTDNIDGYSIYMGSSSDSVEKIAEVVNSANNFDPAAPSVNYNAVTDLGLESGDTVCFRINAYNSSGSSPLSDPICTSL